MLSFFNNKQVHCVDELPLQLPLCVVSARFNCFINTFCPAMDLIDSVFAFLPGYHYCLQ